MPSSSYEAASAAAEPTARSMTKKTTMTSLLLLAARTVMTVTVLSMASSCGFVTSFSPVVVVVPSSASASSSSSSNYHYRSSSVVYLKSFEITTRTTPSVVLKATVEDSAGSTKTSSSAAATTTTTTTTEEGDKKNPFLSSEESKMLTDLYEKAKKEEEGNDDDKNIGENGKETTTGGTEKTKFVQAIEEGLPNLPPNLVMKLKQGWPSSDSSDDDDDDVRSLKESFETIANILYDLSVERLDVAKSTLQSLLNAGEIKKLDSLIGQAARNGNLDVAFFQVLQFNIQDAAASPDQQLDQPPPPDGVDDDDEEEVAASRLQILQHIYTRCQEEVEKVIAPGVALLNKLLRTEQPSIRKNQLEHYLTPQPTKIKSPDGKEIDLGGSSTKTLVEHSDFIDALGRAIQQIRSVEAAGATTLEVAAGMVESCRQVAKEARLAIAESYGPNSEQVLDFETKLQPVFRPSSTDSPYAPSTPEMTMDQTGASSSTDAHQEEEDAAAADGTDNSE